MLKYVKSSKGFAGLLQILIALIIISILYVTVLKTYFKGPKIDEKVEKELSEQGVKTDNPVTIIDSARDNVDAVNKRYSDQYKQFDKE